MRKLKIISQLTSINEFLSLSLHGKTLISLVGIQQTGLVEEVSISSIVIGRHPAISNTKTSNRNPITSFVA